MDAKGWAKGKVVRKLLEAAQGQVSDRQLRLFACDLAHLRWHKMEPECRAWVLGVESHLDGLSGLEEPSLRGLKDHAQLSGPALLARACTYRNAFEAASIALGALKVKKEKLLALVRCVFGNPFLPLVIEPAWLAANDNTVVGLARSISDSRDHARLPILADALEDAGCPHAEALAHLRSKEKHSVNCHVLEAILSAAKSDLPRRIVPREGPRGHPDWPRASVRREEPCSRCKGEGRRSAYLLPVKGTDGHVFLRCELCEDIDWIRPDEVDNQDKARLRAIEIGAGPCLECDGKRKAYRSREGRAFLKCTVAECASFEWADCGTSGLPKVEADPYD